MTWNLQTRRPEELVEPIFTFEKGLSYRNGIGQKGAC